jgi:hypothetical protein
MVQLFGVRSRLPGPRRYYTHLLSKLNLPTEIFDTILYTASADQITVPRLTPFYSILYLKFLIEHLILNNFGCRRSKAPEAYSDGAIE